MSATSLPAGNPALRWLQNAARQLFLPLLGIVTALVVGAVIILISGFNPITAYVGLWEGAFGDLERLNGTLAAATPYIFTTLAVVFAFRGGLFNIGAEGQFRIGAITAAWVGISVGGWSPFIAVPLTLGAGWLAGALWGAIPGALKAFSGAHEVITTIMLNYIAGFITNYLVGSEGPLRGNKMTTTFPVGQNARIPTIFNWNSAEASGSPNTPLSWAFILGIITAGILYWILWRTPLGFEIRTVGLNPSAARYAGIKVARVIVISMAGAGLLAGMAGALEVMGNPNLRYQYSASLGAGYGFNSIAIALLAKNNPIAAIPAALLFAALQSGASQMQFDTVAADGRQLPGDLISIIQALVIIFVAADQVLRWLYRMRAAQGPQVVLSRGWGKAE
ncbi:MAG TPA: ABC transporter permease [Chloroflexia bacterium]|nr:ABC transporter permease [Chloroflexia bacterium]